MNEIEKLIAEINKRHSTKVENDLSDESLMPLFLESKSLKERVATLEGMMRKHIGEEEIKKIMSDYTNEMVPAGTKGVIRGNIFNQMVKDTIEAMNLEKIGLEIAFEKTHPKHPTSEIPDWYVYDASADRILVGMNQLDLWSGGQQTNRGSKYVVENKIDTDKLKLISVIAYHPRNLGESKKMNLFKVGFANNSLAYMGDLKKIIDDYFKK